METKIIKDKELEEIDFIEIIEIKKTTEKTGRKQGKIDVRKIENYADLLKEENIRFSTKAHKVWVKEILESLKLLAEKTGKGDLGKPLKIIDVGCGLGDIDIKLEEEGKKNGLYLEITGIDILDEMIEGAKKKLKGKNSNICFMKGNAINLPFNDESFDFLIATQIFFCLDEKEILTFFDECRRVLTDNGQFYFLSHTRNILFRLIAPIMIKKKVGHEKESIQYNYTLTELKEKIKHSSLWNNTVDIKKKMAGVLVRTTGAVRKNKMSRI